MQTIQAKVNPRLLSKASRLFTGKFEGRIIEILQNARRAGATEVVITNSEGHISVRDNGKGIDDFSRLLDLGGSGWDDTVENSEDPAGVGLFCLAPREVTIRSNSKMVVLGGTGWTGSPVEIQDDPDPIQGTLLIFQDDPWCQTSVTRCAVFSGLDVVVDGESCPKQLFLSNLATHYPDLGCKIEVCESKDLSRWHRGLGYYNHTFVNFHGQVVAFDYKPIKEDLYILVEMTGEPTDIRLMLPARTLLVENQAFKQLKAAIELEAYRYIKNRGRHSLPYKEYLRAHELGVDLPEAKPKFRVGLLYDNEIHPSEIYMPKDFLLANCYRCDKEDEEANVHLLAALGKFDAPFIPVTISSEFDGYSWAQLPTIKSIAITTGNQLHRGYVWMGELTCVDRLEITVETTEHDGSVRVWQSLVCMAIDNDMEVVVTPDAQQLSEAELLYHLGGFSEEGDSYDTQQEQFEEELNAFWSHLIGPDENLRRKIVESVNTVRDWKSITIRPDGNVTVCYNDGSDKVMEGST
jgi:hypothetical protein